MSTDRLYLRTFCLRFSFCKLACIFPPKQDNTRKISSVAFFRKTCLFELSIHKQYREKTCKSLNTKRRSGKLQSPANVPGNYGPLLYNFHFPAYERYKGEAELLGSNSEKRKRGVPLSCVKYVYRIPPCTHPYGTKNIEDA